jgi:CRP-like cAMP-binding protein
LAPIHSVIVSECLLIRIHAVQVPFFIKQPKAFVRTVVGALESDFLSPKGVVVALYAIEELIIVSQGNILVLNQHKELTHVLSAEEWFGEDALFEDRRSQFELEAKTFCEIFRLSRPVFIACMEKHFPKLRIAALMVKQQKPSAPSTSPSLQPVRPTVVKPGNSALLKLISQRREVKPWSWHHPNSNFRKQWRRWKVLFLLFLAVEVPYEIAFKWRRGFFGDDVTLSQQGIYLMAFVTELFFYVDWYFRVLKFSRRSPGRDDPTGPSDPHQHEPTQKSFRAAVAQKRDDLVTQPRELFRLYISSDDVVFDVISIAPISVVWNLVNRSAYGVLLREIMRFTRLLALCRISALKPLMRKIMVEFDFSPASHMLTNVMVFCVIAANGMACYFYLLADDKDFLDALPLGFEERSLSITSQMCLEHATLFGNCTWFMYDRSAFDIHARYVRSLHWSLVLLSTVGYGDIVSFTNSECLIGFWWIYLGAMICYYTSCAVGSVISQVTVLRSARDDRVEEIMRALIRSNVSPATRAMIRSYYEANWEFNGSVIHEDCLMKRLPLSLRHQLASTLYLHALRKCYIFAGFGGQLHIIQEVALAMTSIVALPGLPIVESGHLGESLYLVLSGEMEVLLPVRYRGGSIVTAKQMAFMQKRQAWGPICAALNRWSRTVFSRRSVMDLSSSTDELLAAMATSMIRRRGQDQMRTREVPVAVLKEGDCFGDEALFLHDHRAISVTVRALTSAQIGVLHRNVFVRLSNRFPVQLAQMIALIQERYDENQALHKTIRRSLEDRGKIRDYLGNCRSVFVETITSGIGIITPDQTFYRMWRLVHGLFVFYNFYQITFRLAFAPYPEATTMLKLSVVDYGIDAFFYVDMYLKWNRFGFDRYGETVTNVFEIRRQYKQGWFRIDCLSMVPLYYYGDFFAMTLARLPRLLKSPQLLEYINEIEAMIREKFTKGSTTMVSVFDLVKFLAYFLSAAHHIGSVYFLLGRVLTTYEFSGFSWMTVDPVINANPDSVLVHYNRAIYWCLETVRLLSARSDVA